MRPEMQSPQLFRVINWNWVKERDNAKKKTRIVNLSHRFFDKNGLFFYAIYRIALVLAITVNKLNASHSVTTSNKVIFFFKSVKITIFITIIILEIEKKKTSKVYKN